jgi:hypothetical protein
LLKRRFHDLMEPKYLLRWIDPIRLHCRASDLAAGPARVGSTTNLASGSLLALSPSWRHRSVLTLSSTNLGSVRPSWRHRVVNLNITFPIRGLDDFCVAILGKYPVSSQMSESGSGDHRIFTGWSQCAKGKLAIHKFTKVNVS